MRGKTGARTVVPHIDVKEIVANLLARRPDQKADEYLFMMPDGSQVTSLRDQFDKLLEVSKLTFNAAGAKHSSTASVISTPCVQSLAISTSTPSPATWGRAFR